MTSLVQARNTKVLAIHCMPDHLHLFVGFKPSVLIADFVKEIKVKSNEFINAKQWVQGTFSWQEGYGVFSYGHSQIDAVCKYIQNQEMHHQKKTFRQEYHAFLEKFAIPFEEQYLFEWVNKQMRLKRYGALTALIMDL